MIEHFDERIAGIDESIVERERWLEQDTDRLQQARERA